MMDAVELREALDTPLLLRALDQRKLIDAAAHTIALPILERDEGLVERIAFLLSTIQGELAEYNQAELAGWARAILATLITTYGVEGR